MDLHYFCLGLLAFPAGWASQRVVEACGESNAFVLGDCQIGGAFWMAVAGTVSGDFFGRTNYTGTGTRRWFC